MELLFLVKKDRQKTNQQINFGSEYIFAYKDNIVEIEKNHLYIPNFYTSKNSFSKEKTVIRNFSLIVGPNGSGKTEIIKTIINFYNQTGSFEPHIEEFILIIFKDSQGKLVLYSFENDIEISRPEELLLDIKIEKFKLQSSHEYIFIRNRPFLDDTFVIFFSNVFDTAQKIIGQNIFDVSTNALVGEINIDNKKILVNKKLRKYGNFEEIDLSNQLILKDNQDKINYFSSEFYKNTFFEFNRSVRLEVKHNIEIKESIEKYNIMLENEVKKLIENHSLKSNLQIDQIINRIKSFNPNVLEEITNNNDLIEQNIVSNDFISELKLFVIPFKISSALHIFKRKYDDIVQLINDRYKNAEVLDKNIFISKILYDFYDIAISAYLSINLSINRDLEEFDSFFSMIKTQDNLFFDTIDYKINIESISQSKIQGCQEVQALLEYIEKNKKINNFGSIIFEDVDELKEWYYDLYLKSTFYHHNYFKIYFDQMSSGQTAIMNLFSRIYGVYDEVKERDNILILIDEIELYLHPQWQKQIIFNLIEFVEKLFVNKNVQIIATTNNAIPVSDFLKSNVVLIGSEISKFDEQRDTFGGNIFNIFSDNFFVQNGFIGDFSKNKINELIDILYEKPIEYLVDNMDLIERKINSIGEKLIKNKLIEILQDRLNANLLSIKSQLDNLNERLSKLEENE